MKFDGFDTLEVNSFEKSSVDLISKLSGLNKAFESRMTSEYDAFLSHDTAIDDNLSRWLDIENTNNTEIIGIPGRSFYDTIQQMYHGMEGEGILGLKEISKWKINPECYYQNLKAHAGYAAEVISTAKENLLAQKEGTGVTTYRADDRPDLFKKNDQFVDKIRVDAEGKIIDKIQTKFVGKDGSECLSKLMSKKYDKYFNDGVVNKLEIPKDFYDQIKNENLIGKELENLEKQLKSVTEKGKSEAAENIQKRIDKLNKIDDMLDRSTVTSQEAIYAVKHTDRYVKKLFVKETALNSHNEGLKNAYLALALTATMSTVDNIQQVMDGKISPQEAFVDVAKDTGAAGVGAYGTAFISNAVSAVMSKSSYELMNSLSSAGLPAMAVSFAVESYDSVMDYAQGTIDGKQLAIDLGENATGIGGATMGTAMTAAALGSVVPGAGTIVGFGVGMIGGMIGYTVASGAYMTAIEHGGEAVDVLETKAESIADNLLQKTREIAPEHVADIKEAIIGFNVANHLPFNI